uniref:Enkurin domain containing 1 n=1 Tax=Athene cunicularia TaxID=194338 RepID=A0A663MS28_ATHCN
MCEGPSRISGPIPPDPTLFPNYYKRPFSARGRLEGNDQKQDFTSDPLDPAQPVPRIRPSGRDFLEKGQKGTLSLLLQLEGICLDGGLPVKRRESKDHEKENVRRIKEIQKKCKEKERAQEHSQPKPVKALWKSQKYENVESKVKAKLQESSPPPNPEALKFLRAYSRCGPGIKPCRLLSPRPTRMKAGADTEGSVAFTGLVGAQPEPRGLCQAWFFLSLWL